MNCAYIHLNEKLIVHFADDKPGALTCQQLAYYPSHLEGSVQDEDKQGTGSRTIRGLSRKEHVFDGHHHRV